MRISIALASFNGGRYLHEQLRSFAAQTRLPDQVVVTDDLSTDQTIQVARDFAKDAPFEVIVESNPRRLGVTSNFDRALSLCNGDLVFLSDQDDVWFPEKIATLVDLATSRPAAACWMVDALLADEKLVPTGTGKMQQIRSAGLPATAMVMGCCAAFRRDLLDLLLPIPGDQPAHDTWLVQVADLLSLVERVELPMQWYRRHGRNVSQARVNRINAPRLGERFWQPVRDVLYRVTGPGGLEREHAFLEAAAARLRERFDAVRSLVGANAETVLAEIEGRAARLRRRREIRALPLLRRPRHVLELWHSGAYGDTGGWRGAAKDALGPREGHPRR